LACSVRLTSCTIVSWFKWRHPTFSNGKRVCSKWLFLASPSWQFFKRGLGVNSHLCGAQAPAANTAFSVGDKTLLKHWPLTFCSSVCHICMYVWGILLNGWHGQRITSTLGIVGEPYLYMLGIYV
jgi:hypothetical protein